MFTGNFFSWFRQGYLRVVIATGAFRGNAGTDVY
jgi:hypothetical protein